MHKGATPNQFRCLNSDMSHWLNWLGDLGLRRSRRPYLLQSALNKHILVHLCIIVFSGQKNAPVFI